MTLVKFIKILAEEMRESGHTGIAGDLRMLGKLLEDGETGAAKHFIKQFLVDDARPLVPQMYNAIYRAIAGDEVAQ